MNLQSPCTGDRGARAFRSSLTSLGLLAAPILLLSAGCADPPAPAGEAVGEAQQHLTQCVTFQRGTYGTVADTVLASNNLNANFGAQGTLSTSKKDEVLFRADLGAIPSYAVVDSATLKLYVNLTGNGAAVGIVNGNGNANGLGNGNGNNTAFEAINLHRVTAAWSEGSVTFTSFAQHFDSAIVGVILPTGTSSLKSVDLTTLVQSWVSGTQPNHGVLLETVDSKATVFVSSEGGAATLRPALDICYSVPDDHCTPNPCDNGGACINDWTGYTCQCAPGFTGTDCEININDCADAPCLNGGTCVDGISSYTCQCAPGFTGASCQTNIDDCATQPCVNGGVCADGVNAYACTCVPGYAGTNCEIDINECAAQPCENGGTCTDGVNDYTCACATGFTGTNCEINIDDCPGNLCENDASCVDGVASYTCACVPGFSGTYCEVDINECAGNPCLHDATCTDGVNGYTCACAPGYTGTNCEIDIDDCTPNPCQNEGICVDGVNGYTCQCDPIWSGVSCEVPAGPACPCAASPLWETALALPGAQGSENYYDAGVDMFDPVANIYYGAGVSTSEPFCGVYSYDVATEVYTEVYLPGITPDEASACRLQINLFSSCADRGLAACNDGINCYDAGYGTCTGILDCADATDEPESCAPICACNDYWGTQMLAAGGACTSTATSTTFTSAASHLSVDTSLSECTVSVGAPLTTWPYEYTRGPLSLAGADACESLYEATCALCNPSPCLNGGSCTSTTSQYTCTCTAGWTGTKCEIQPTYCGLVRLQNPAAGDGLYTFTVAGHDVELYCHDMAGNPKEYLALAQTGAGHNFSSYDNEGQITSFTKVRFHPDTLAVDLADFTFSTSLNGGPTRYAFAGDCAGYDSQSGTANVDLTGTPFAIAPDQITVQGWYPAGSITYGALNKTADLVGGGYCGVTTTANYAAAPLVLVYQPDAPTCSAGYQMMTGACWNWFGNDFSLHAAIEATGFWDVPHATSPWGIANPGVDCTNATTSDLGFFKYCAVEVVGVGVGSCESDCVNNQCCATFDE